jgi:hypothetical protein
MGEHDGNPLQAWAEEAGAGLAGSQLDEALAGIHQIAQAAGIFEQTWHATSIGEVCGMIAAWITDRRAEPQPTGGVGMYRAAEPVEAGQQAGTWHGRDGDGLVRPYHDGDLRLGEAINPAPPGGMVWVRRP